MQQLRFPRQMKRELSGCFGKEKETLGVVRVVHPKILIQALAVVIVWLVQEVNGEAVSRCERPNFGADAGDAQWNIERNGKRLHSGKPLANAGVKRSDDADLVPCSSQ